MRQVGKLANLKKEVPVMGKMLKHLGNARRWFIRHFVDVCKAVEKEQSREPKHDRKEVAVWRTDDKVTITGLHAMMAEKAEVVMLRVFKKSIMRGLGGSPEEQEIAQVELWKMLHGMVAKGFYPMPIAKTNRKIPGKLHGFLFPLIKGMKYGDLFKETFGLKVPLVDTKEIKEAMYAGQPIKSERKVEKKVLVAPGEMFGNLMDGCGFTRTGGMAGMKIPKNAIAKIIGIGDRGDGVAAINKGLVLQADEQWIKSFHDFFIKFGVERDIMNKILKHVEHGGEFATDNTVKFANLDGVIKEMMMTMFYHDDSSTQRRRFIRLTDTWGIRALFTPEGEKAVLEIARSHARNMRDAFKDPKTLGLWLEKLTIDNDEDPEDVAVTVTAQRMSNIVKECGPDFGTARTKIERLIVPLVRKRAARPEMPGTIQFIYPHFGLPKNTLAVARRNADDLDLKVGDMMNVVRYPMYSDGAASWPIHIITSMDGIAVSGHVSDRLRFLLDFDGDKFVAHATRHTGMIRTREFPDEVKTKSWVKFMPHARQMRGGHFGRLISDLVSAASGIGGNSGIGQKFRKRDAAEEAVHRQGIKHDEATMDAVRIMEHKMIQPAVEGLKNDVGNEIDVKESMKAFVEETGIEVTARSLSHTLLTGLGTTKGVPQSMFDEHPGVAIIGKKHPVVKEIRKLRAVIGETKDGELFIDRNKILKKIGKSDVEIPIPLVRVILEELAGIEVPKTKNNIHLLAKEFLSNKTGAGDVARMMGWDPIRHDRIDGGFIIDILNAWGWTRDTGGNQTTAQQRVNKMSEDLAVHIHEKSKARGWTLDEVKVLMLIVLMAYESRRSKGLYGGMFVFPPEYMGAAVRILNRRWLLWLAKDELAFDKRVNDFEDSLGLEHGVVSKKLKLGGIGRNMARTIILRKKGGTERVHNLCK